jgi:hypothetical protein
MSSYPAVVFVQPCKILLTNLFDGEKKLFNFNRGELSHARIDEKGAGEVYYLDDEGWGGVICKELVEKFEEKN